MNNLAPNGRRPAQKSNIESKLSKPSRIASASRSDSLNSTPSIVTMPIAVAFMPTSVDFYCFYLDAPRSHQKLRPFVSKTCVQMQHISRFVRVRSCRANGVRFFSGQNERNKLRFKVIKAHLGAYLLSRFLCGYFSDVKLCADFGGLAAHVRVELDDGRTLGE